MSFLKSMWKTNNSRHKKLCEEWALATSLRDLGDDLPDTIEDADSSTFAVKHLGETIVETANSTQATSEAVKSVISAAKAKGNKLTRINLTVSPKGIEVIDRVSGETLQQISIYRISYCSADATHNNVFAFISSAPAAAQPTTEEEEEEEERCSTGDDESREEQFPSANADGPLTCHVFLCSKRKMAQNISLTVAKSFERAFDIWKSISHRRLIRETRQMPRYDSSPSPRPDTVPGEAEDEEQVMNLLIDLNADLTDIRKSYLQNTWVSFEETEHLMSNLHKNAICS